MPSESPMDPTPTYDFDRLNALNQIKSEILNERASMLNRWLTIVSLVLTFFGILVGFGTFFGLSAFRALEKDARDAVSRIEEHEKTAQLSKLSKDDFNRPSPSIGGPTSASPQLGRLLAGDDSGEAIWSVISGAIVTLTKSGTLSESDTESIRFDIESTGSYWLFASCDECSDLDMVVSSRQSQDGEYKTLDQDTLPDAIPITSFEAREGDEVLVEVEMYMCPSKCGWELTAYRLPGSD